MLSLKHVTWHANAPYDCRGPKEPWEHSGSKTFEIVPSGKPKADAKLAMQVEKLIEAFLSRDNDMQHVEIVRRLLRLHAQRRLVWPTPLFLGMTSIQGPDLLRLTSTVLKLVPGARAMRRRFEERGDAPHAHWESPQKKTDAATKIFRVVASVMFSTTERIETEDDFSELMFERFVLSVADRYVCLDKAKRQEVRKAAKITANYFVVVHGNSRFGINAMKAIGGQDVAPEKAFAQDWFRNRWLKSYGEAWIASTILRNDREHRRVVVNLHRFLAKLGMREAAGPHTAFARHNMLALIEDSTTWTKSVNRRIEALNRTLEFLIWLRKHLIENKLQAFEVALDKGDYAHLYMEAPPRQGDQAVVAARPMPIEYHAMLKQIIADNDFQWPKGLLDAEGRQIHYVTSLDPALKGALVFCPVIPRLLLLLLDLPIRTVQARRLDSGEGDAQRWNPNRKAWEVNSGRNAGFWRQIGVKNTRRGVVSEGRSEDGKSVTGLWINSNKTQDKGKGFDEKSGYFIPWQHDDVIANVLALRRWQEQHNPVRGPLPHHMLRKNTFADSPSRLVAGSLPDHFYLFRRNQGIERGGRESPVTYAQLKELFLAALGRLEERLRETNPTVNIVTRNEARRPIDAIYSMHGMRSALLTSLSDAGVPLEVLSRLIAGHASMLMTLKYIKHDYKHISEVLSGARVFQMNEARSTFPEQIKDAGLEGAKAFTARTSDDAFEQARGMNAEPTAWSQLEIGLCPNQGTRCAEGGPKKHSRDQARIRSTTGPAPGGRNCVRCRFFITGVPFLMPLWAQAMATGAKLDGLIKEVEGQEKVVEDLRVQKYDADRQNETVDRVFVSRLKRAEEDLASLRLRRDTAVGDLYATMTLVEKVRAIATEPAAKQAGGMALLVDEQEVPEVVGQEASRFEIVDAVVQASMVFPSLRSPELERERLGFMDRMLYRGGLEPLTVSGLTEAEVRIAADAMAKYLVTRKDLLDVEALTEGRKTLQELDLQDKLAEVCRRAVGRPLDRLAGQAHETAIILQAAE